MDRIREFLSFAGKGEDKVIAVFGMSAAPCDRAVRHVQQGAPDIPVWLFALRDPSPETAARCQRVFVDADPLALFCTAQKALWPHWVALTLATWTGERGGWPVKLAPLLVPPFRALLLNAQGDFFPGKPGAVLRHVRRAWRDAAHSGANRVQDVHRGAWLWLGGVLAGRCTWALRYAFRRIEGKESWPDSLPRVSGDTITEFHYHHRQWDWRVLDTLVRNSRARWILFVADDAHAKTGDLAEVWNAYPEAFAAARQRSFRAWQQAFIARAPFRRLQPGEVTQTLAPVSDVMLVDRARLAALGVPRTLVPGTAWLLLFWKAAAAGWPAYTVGGAEPLPEQPDWPLEEAEFVLRRLADPQVRRLRPKDTELSRANIAFQPGYMVPSGQSRHAGRRPCVLVVSPYLPWPLSHGGAVRIYNLCRALAGRVDFLLIAFRERHDVTKYERLHEVFRRVWIVDRDQRPSKDTALPHQVRDHASDSMRALIRQVTREESVDVLQVEYTHLAAFRDAAPEVPAILVEHDLTFTLYQQYAGLEGTSDAHAEYRRWLAFERHWWREYDAIWTMSQADHALAIENGSSGEKTHLVPNGVDTARFSAGETLTEYPEVLYVGSLRHRPNVLGLRKLLREIMPRVWQRCPEARLRVVAGPEPHRYWNPSGKLDARVLIHAFVEDLRPLYARAAAVAVPLLVSAGTNIKVMEAMACGKSVVTTPIGCAGLGLENGRNVLIREDAVTFAIAIGDLLGSADLRAAIGSQARATVEERFTWESIAGRALTSYRALSGAPVR